jgi:hypothetical protein
MWVVAYLDDDYITKMENVLEVYERSYDPQQPVVCLDEKPITLHADVRSAPPVEPPIVEWLGRNGARRVRAPFWHSDPASMGGWPSLVATLQRPDWPLLADHLPHRFQPVGDDPQTANLATGLGHRHRDGLGMDIQSYKA